MDNIAVQTTEPVAPQEGQPQEPSIDWMGLTGFEGPEAIRETTGRLSSVEAELNELRAKASTSPFASPLIEQMNKLAADGRDTNSLTRFITLQSQDFDNMSAEDAVKWQKRMAMPKWGDSEVNDWFNGKYPVISADDDDNAIAKNRQRDLILDEEAENARKELNQMKVDAGKPDETKQQQQALLQQRQQQLTSVAETLIGGIREIPIAHEGEGWKYELGYKPNITPEMKKTVIQAVVADHAGRGTTLDEAGLQKIKGDAMRLVRMLSMDDMIKAIINDTRASMLESTVKEVSNSKPVGTGTPAPPRQQPAKPQEFVQHRGKTYI